MARSHAKILASIWHDEDWTSIPVTAQWLYFVLLSQPKLSLVGVLDVRPQRLAGYAPDRTVADVKADLAELEQRDKVLFDTDTEECLIRSFLKHDLAPGRLNSNLLKGMWSAWRAVDSAMLRTEILHSMPPELWTNEKCATPADAKAWRVQNPTSRRLEPAVLSNGSNRASELLVRTPVSVSITASAVCVSDWLPVDKQERNEGAGQRVVGNHDSLVRLQGACAS